MNNNILFDILFFLILLIFIEKKYRNNKLNVIYNKSI